MVEGPARLAVPHQHAGHAEAPRAAHQFVAGHARAALDESRPHESASGLVHPRRVGDLAARSEEHTSELQSQSNLVCRLLLEKKKIHLYHAGTRAAPSSLQTQVICITSSRMRVRLHM